MKNIIENLDNQILKIKEMFNSNIKSIKINNLGIKELISYILLMQIFIFIVILFDSIFFNLPIIRELLVFVYLIFVPGILIIRILGMNDLNTIETLLYAVGLSIASLMILVLAIDIIYPFFGILKPLTIVPLFTTINIFTLFLCYLSYKRDINPLKHYSMDIKSLLSPSFLFICLLPFLSIIGTYVMNLYGLNVFLMVLLCLIALIPILVVFDKIPKHLYPLTIFISAISLLYFVSLISSYTIGWDVQGEYYLSNLVFQNGFWDYTMEDHYNTVISTNILSNIFSILCGLDLTWVFKTLYPFIFALVPVGMYEISRNLIKSDKGSFLAVFLFISIFSFYGELVFIAKQQIAELFLVLLILLMLNKSLSRGKMLILTAVFSLSLIVSHYALSFLFLYCTIFALLFKTALKIPNYLEKGEKRIFINTKQKSGGIISFYFILFFILFTSTWYICISNSYEFRNVLNILTTIINSFNQFLNAGNTQGLETIINKPLPFHSITKYLHIISQLFISIGILSYLINIKRKKINIDYLALSLGFYSLLVLSITIPNFSSQLNTTRIYHIALIVLVPFLIIGLKESFRILEVLHDKYLKKKNIIKSFGILEVFDSYFKRNKIKLTFKFIAIFLTIFLLFNSGFVYKISGEVSTATALIALDQNFDYPRFNDKEVAGSEWISGHKYEQAVYADQYRNLLLISKCNSNEVEFLLQGYDKITRYNYIYFGTLNLAENKFYIPYSEDEYMSTECITSNFNKIYDNRGSAIYY